MQKNTTTRWNFRRAVVFSAPLLIMMMAYVGEIRFSYFSFVRAWKKEPQPRTNSGNLLQPDSTAAMVGRAKQQHTHKAAGLLEEIAQPVRWVADQVWFDQEREKGCCPFAETLYGNRYKHIQNRCCTERLDMIQPLRPTGGITWEQIRSNPAFSQKLYNRTILLQGDSLGQQRFIALLCNVWAVEPERYNSTIHLTELHRSDQANWWRAKLLWDNNNMSLSLTVDFARWSSVGPIDANEMKIDYTMYDYLIFDGWHHRDVHEQGFQNLAHHVLSLRKNQYAPQSAIFVEPLPNHFPKRGEVVSNNHHHPPDEKFCLLHTDASCRVCENLQIWLRGTNVTIMPHHDLYRSRGDAHIGKAGKDCLHWCLAPGVLDGLIRQTYSTLLQVASLEG